MTAETPTPLTDSLADCIGGYGHVYQLEQWYDLCCQFEIRCAELERENAKIMLSDQGRLRSKLASYEGQIAELERAVSEGITGPYIDRLAEDTAFAAGLDKSDWHTWTDINKRIAELRHQLAAECGHVDALNMEIAELRRDRERLDHLETMPCSHIVRRRRARVDIDGQQLYGQDYKTCRDAIDAAIENKA